MKPSLSVQTDSIAAEHVQQRRSPYHDDQHQSYGHPQQYHHHPAPNAYGTGYETAYPIGYSPRHQTDTLHPPQGGRPHRPNSYAQGYGYDLNVSPRHSLDVPSPRLGDSKTPDRGLPSSSTSKVNETHEVEEVHERIPSPSSGGSPKSSSGPGAEEEEAQRPRITPSIRLLFSLLTPRHRVLLLLPAILSSIISGGIAPFMTYVVGQAFDAFANFPLSSSSVSSSSIPPDELKAAKDELLKQVGIAALSLLGLALGSLAMGSLTSFLWIWVGEVNAAEVRKRVYLGIMEKSMGWFDSRMGDSDVPAQGKKTKEGEEENGEMDGPVGAGGLMAKFTRETDDVRQASSLASGLLIQHLTTSLTCLVLAFVQSWALTLVILATVPVLVVIQGFSQGMASPLLGAERHGMAISATLLERTLTSITTVKAFNAQSLSLSTSSNIFHNLLGIGRRLAGVWGVTSAVSQFVMMGMFVQGFWFGSKLVREGKIGAGEVMAVFWACLIATSNLQACIPQMILLGKGKEAAGSLKGILVTGNAPGPGTDPAANNGNAWDEGIDPPQDFLALPPPSKPASAIPAHMALHSQSPRTPKKSLDGMQYPPMSPATAHANFFQQREGQGEGLDQYGRPLTGYSGFSALSYGSAGSGKVTKSKKLFERQRTTSTSKKLRKIVPTKCYGEMALHGVTFSYPTRVDVEVLKDVEMYLPSGELTFVVGSSGSGKSSVASLLLGLYKICESPQNKGHISLDEQDIAYLDPDWVRSKVMGITQSSCVVLEGKTVAENVSCVVRNRTPTREEIEEACRAALLHDFILDLPNGYDTILGGSAPPPGLDVLDDEASAPEKKPKTSGEDEVEGGEVTKAQDDAYRGGITLSGGQKQRLSFARARLRNPEVLILDEATSALDPTSRLLVFSAMKNWRRNKTTIVITHDLSQIEQQDFVYVIRSGRVVERGYRVDLEAVNARPPTLAYDQDDQQLETGGDGRGEFRKMLDSQLLTGGYLPEKDLDSPIGDADDEEEEEQVIELELDDREKSNKHQSLIRPITLGNWMFDVVAELVGGGEPSSNAVAGPSGTGGNRDSVDAHPSNRKTASWGRAFATPKPFKRPSSSGMGFGITPPSAYAQRAQWNSNYGPGLQASQASSNVLQLSPIKERRHSAQTLAPLSPVSGVSPLRINTTLANQTVVKEEEEGGTSPVSPTGVYGYAGGAGTTTTTPSNDRKVRGRLSLQFVPATPSSATFTLGTGGWNGGAGTAAAAGGKRTSWGTKRGSYRSYGGWKEDEDGDFQERYQKRFTQESFEVEKEAVKKSGGVAKSGRSERGTTRGRPSQGGVQEMADVKQMRRQHPSGQDAEAQHEGEEEAPPAFWALLRRVYPTLPNKPLLIFGLVVCVLSGAMTPVFSFLLSRLLFEVSIGARNVNIINIFGGVVLSVAALDGFLLGLKYFIMELCGIAWVTELRRIAFERVLKQDTKWFDDKDRHSPARIVQIIVKDAEDARNLVAVVMGQCLVVSAMLGVGLVWAMVRGWELTLVGLGVAPVFGIVMSVQTRLVAKCEVRNKRAREALARSYYESILNIRAIRSLSLNRLFWDQFEQHSERALKTGVKGAFVEGCTYGIASGLIYLAEALLFYVGAVLIAKERYSYLQMVETLNLVVFSVTIGSQLMAFTEKIAKSAQATSDLYTLVELATNTSESHGSRRDPLCGPITLRNVSFAYPSRPTARVLNDLSLTIRQGECVAIVGHSGCGKSTLATLLQRLYEADVGEVRIGTEDGRSVNVRDVDVQWLRDHVAVVSQHPHLFDASVADNIRYGTSYSPSQPSTNLQGPPDYETATITHDDIIAATKAASVHDFIMSLPQGYDTVIGENAVLISGGQAQRIQIARALVRPRTRILILDECTSALDPENQAVVMESIRGLVRGDDGVVGKEKKTIVMVTHKVQVMQMCDRIVVLGDGEVKEEGTFDELVRRKGAFAALASGGEWNGD